MTPTIAAVCAVFFAVSAADERIAAELRDKADSAMVAIIDAAPDQTELDAQVRAIFAAIKADPAHGMTFLARRSSECIQMINDMAAARYE